MGQSTREHANPSDPADEPYYDPFSREINRNPHPVFKRLRDERPLYYNPHHDFYAVSRFDDLQRIRLDTDTFISSQGVAPIEKMGDTRFLIRRILEMDPPDHTAFRHVTRQWFTPRAIGRLEDAVRGLCLEFIEPLVDAERFDYVQDFAKHIPMLATCYLLGIDREEQKDIGVLFAERDHLLSQLVDVGDFYSVGEAETPLRERLLEIAQQRLRDPRDDLITALAQARADEPDLMTEEELGEYCLIIFNGGNGTTMLLMGWIASVLARHPSQRRLLVEQPDLITNAVEEILRFEPVSHVQGRVVTRDVELHDEVIPEGSKLLLLTGSACRDERQYENPDEFDVQRHVGANPAFGFGPHTCLGANLARLEARIALEETLARFPEWDVDESGAEMQITSTLRGYSHLPFVPAA